MPAQSLTLLIAFDGSAGAAAATRTAAALFPGARAIVLAAATAPQTAAEAAIGVGGAELPPDLLARLRQAADEQAAATAADGADLAESAGLAAEPEAVHGDRTSSAIRAAALRHQADLVVCGARGIGGFSRAMLGSVSTSLLHHADRPLLVVPDAAGGASGPIVIGYDGSPAARAAIEAAGELFPRRAAIVATVWESRVRHTLSGKALLHSPLDEVRELASELDASLAADAERIAAEGAEAARAHGLAAQPRAVEASAPAWRGLAEVARSAGASVVVAGSRGRGGVASALLGSVTAGLVHNADLPILVIPG